MVRDKRKMHIGTGRKRLISCLQDIVYHWLMHYEANIDHGINTS